MNSEEQKKLREEVNKIYTPLSVAKKEIWRRWNDKKLRKKVEDFLEGKIPKPLKREPKAVLTRHIASPNKEFIRFLDLSDLIGLKPRCLEYCCDKFRAENQDKYYLGKLFFFNGIGKKWGDKTDVLKVINFNDSEGKQFTKIKTLWKENFVDFHHRLLKCIVKDCNDIISDESDWIKNNGKAPVCYYEKLLTLFICYGVLFENYLDSEEHFIRKVLLPNFKKVREKFEVTPLIVKLFPSGSDNDLYWQYYPKSLEKVAKKVI